MTDFFKTGFGWITPDGRLIGGDHFSHINLLREEPTLQFLFEELEQVSDECSKLANNGEHPEWHRYDMFVYDVIQDVYRLGYIRLGVYPLWGLFEAEGAPKIIRSRMDLLNRLKEQFEQENNVELKIKIHRR